MQRSFLFRLISVGAFLLALTATAARAARANDQPPAPSTAPSKPPDSASNHSQSNSASLSTPTGSTSQAPKTPEHKAKLPRMVIVVTASRMPQPLGEVGDTASVVSRQRIAVQQIQTVTDALREVPGVDVTQSGSPGTVTDVSIRGSSASQTLILIDGVPVNDSATDSFDISRLPTDGLDRIEVVRGAGGALYGSQAIGGVVNLIAREGSGPPKFTLLSMGGNRASQRQVLTLEGARGKLAYSGSLSYFSTTGFRPINDNSDNLSGTMRLDYHLDENTTLHGFARYTRANISLASFSIFNGITLNPNAHQRNEFMLFKGGIDHQFGERLLIRSSAFYVRDVLRLNAYRFPGNPSSEDSYIPDETRGGNLEGIYSWTPNLRTLVGFDFLDRWVHSGDDFISFALPPLNGQTITVFNARRQEYAGYVEQEARLFDGHLIGTGGFRVDGNSQFGKEVSPAWAVAIPFEQSGTTLRGSYSEGFRAPSFNELFFPNFGNPNLSPEISSEYDGGVTQSFGETVSLTATYFSRRVHHLIVTVPCTPNPQTCRFGSMAGNAGRVDTEGVEIVPRWSPIHGFELGGSVTILDQTHATPAPRPLRVPKYSASAQAQYTHRNLFRDDDQVTASMAYFFVGDRDDITTIGTIANHDAYHRVDAAFSYSPGLHWRAIRDVSFVARVENLLDRHYSEAFGFPSPPVNFMAGVKLDF